MASDSDPCASPMRATSMPASIMRRSTVGSLDDGPIVAMILVRRLTLAAYRRLSPTPFLGPRTSTGDHQRVTWRSPLYRALASAPQPRSTTHMRFRLVPTDDR